MNRRNFFRTMIGGVATAAAVRTWPFRVYSFPSGIKTPQVGDSIIEANRFYSDMQQYLAWDKNLKTWIVSPEQAAALESLVYRVTRIDQEKREITFETMKRSQYNWAGLKRTMLDKPVEIRR